LFGKPLYVRELEQPTKRRADRRQATVVAQLQDARLA
jgi:hypothetical protein